MVQFTLGGKGVLISFAASPQGTGSTRRTRHTHMKTILFIEDEQALQRTMGVALQKGGYEVLQALNGEDGLRIAKEKHPDLILLDLILPRIDGFGVLKQVKEESVTEDIPVIVLTNLESADDVDKALELGATTYLVKANYNLEDVLGKVKAVLGE